LKADSKYFLYALVLVFFVIVAFSYLTVNILELFELGFAISFGIFVSAVAVSMFLLWKFAKTVEDVGFKKRIKVSEIKEGDVPTDFKVWEGITKEQIKELKKSKKKYVWIKEGVRFAPAFTFALIFTLFFGEGFLWLLGLMG
jgi:hypothetical protein